jgi:DNA-binding PucR family transcriptional regulator
VTLADVLDLPILRAATLVAPARPLPGSSLLQDRPVAGVSVIEVPVDGFVRANDLVLSTGMTVGHDPTLLTRFLTDVAHAGAAALALAIGPYTPQMPRAIIALARQLDLPLITLPWETRFSEIVESVLRHLVYETAQIQERRDFVWALSSPAMTADRILVALQRDPEALALLDRYIEPLRRVTRMPLLRTLEVFFDQDCNASETARQLSISRQSLLYRLQKIETVLGVDLHNAEHRFAMLLSLRLRRLQPS